MGQKMTDEERGILHILSLSKDYIAQVLNEQISALTLKALEVNIDDKSRLVALSGRKELMNFKSVLEERHKSLVIKKKEEEEEKNV